MTRLGTGHRTSERVISGVGQLVGEILDSVETPTHGYLLKAVLDIPLVFCTESVRYYTYVCILSDSNKSLESLPKREFSQRVVNVLH